MSSPKSNPEAPASSEQIAHGGEEIPPPAEDASKDTDKVQGASEEVPGPPEETTCSSGDTSETPISAESSELDVFCWVSSSSSSLGEGPSAPAPGPSRRETLQECKARRKREMEARKEEGAARPPTDVVTDPYANAVNSHYVTRGKTGLAFMKKTSHRCEWDRDHPENPDRLTAILSRLEEEELISQCQMISTKRDPNLREKICLVHSEDLYGRLEHFSNSDDLEFLENMAMGYDSIYFNKNTFKAACLAAEITLNLVSSVARKEIQNGFALVRPPGHHAMHDEYNGYCFFNNVAIATEHVIKSGLVKKVLIVDMDVHHGQGIQKMFYNRNDVLYFSMHRYEYGKFWPNLFEGNYNFIGEGDGLGYNINIPLNSTGLTDADYISVVLNVLMPVAYEFNPNLIILAAGYDAAIGCPEGRMNVSPGFFAHLISLLSVFAQGQIACVLEGGYFLPSLSEGVAMTLKALLGKACPLLRPIRHVHPTVLDTIRNVKSALCRHWNCFKICEVDEKGKYEIFYYGDSEKPPYSTRDCYPKNTPRDRDNYHKVINTLRQKYKQHNVRDCVFFSHDQRNLAHRSEQPSPERPERTTTAITTFKEFGIYSRMIRCNIRLLDYASFDPHFCNLIDRIDAGHHTMDLYVNPFTKEAIDLCASAMLLLCDAIMQGKCRSAFAVIRPPGHHADHDTAMGFCFLNNLAVAATYLRKKYNIERILIIDFDIHHGNGTQNIFYDNSNVLYISVHRFDEGRFFPTTRSADVEFDGYGLGKGFNVNIPFSNDKMGDTEYIATFLNVILPIAYGYAPQVVLVSAGFDAGINDPLGGGYKVSPETFGHFIQLLKPLAEGRLLLALEGGYNLTTTSYGATICAKTLLGDPVLMPKDIFADISDSAIDSLRRVIKHQQQHYHAMDVHQPLGTTPVLMKAISHFTQGTHEQEVPSRVLDPKKINDLDYMNAEFNALHFPQ